MHWSLLGGLYTGFYRSPNALLSNPRRGHCSVYERLLRTTLLILGTFSIVLHESLVRVRRIRLGRIDGETARLLWLPNETQNLMKALVKGWSAWPNPRSVYSAV